MLTVTDAPRAFHVMVKPTGAICNLDCEYCFFLSKEVLYPDSNFRMSTDLLETYISQLLAAHPDDEEVVFAFQGGEPTMMGVDFFRLAVSIQKKLARPGQRILNTVQTNATLLDDTWGQFLAEEKFLVGVSIDGPPAMHDAFRRDKGGKPTFERVIRGLNVLKKYGVEWNALTTIKFSEWQTRPRGVHLPARRTGAGFIQFIPIVERSTPELLPQIEEGWSPGTTERPLYVQSGSLTTYRSIDPGEYGQFLIDVFEEWIRHDIGDVFVQMFDTALGHWLGMDQAGMCVHAKTCGDALALEHNGDLYSCDHYVEPDHLLGNIADGRTMLQLLNSPQQKDFGNAKLTTLTDYCLKCDVRFACNGGCPKDRFTTAPTGEPGLHYLCPGYERFFRHVDEPMKVMAGLLRSGQDATAIKPKYAQEDAARRRNDPCPCQSGRKWKNCHGRPVIPHESTR